MFILTFFLRCQKCADRTKMRKNYILTLTSYLEHTSTNETTIRVLVHYLNAWLQQLQ
jgi:hypothetical protein